MRKRTFVIMSVVSVLYLVFWGILLHYFNRAIAGNEMDDMFRPVASYMVTQMGLQFSSMLMALLTIMLSAGSISTEIENGLVHAIISRPIHRHEYVLGKLIGFSILSCIYATVLFAFLLGIGSVFELSTVTSLTFLQIIKGWLLYMLIPVAVICLTLYGSCSLKTVPNGLLMIFIYIIGNAGGMVEMVGKYINNDSVISAGIFVSLISPFHTLYSTTERILLPTSGIMENIMRSTGGLSGSGAPPSVFMYIYIGFYMLFFVMLSIRKFGKKDIV